MPDIGGTEIIVILYVVSTVAAVLLARRRYGRITGTILGLVLGALLGPVALIMLVILPRRRATRPTPANPRDRRSP